MDDQALITVDHPWSSFAQGWSCSDCSWSFWSCKKEVKPAAPQTA